ncbi:MAG: hypothetical protein AAFY98_11900 [Verrucomicrobiota bacterium]
MAVSNQSFNYAIPNLIGLVTVLAGIYTTVAPPESQRPTRNNNVEEVDAPNDGLFNARLWEDPFSALYQSNDEEGVVIVVEADKTLKKFSDFMGKNHYLRAPVGIF